MLKRFFYQWMKNSEKKEMKKGGKQQKNEQALSSKGSEW